MPFSTRSSISNEPADINFAYFLAKPFVAWNPFVNGVHTWMQACSVAQASMQKEWFSFVTRRLQADAAQMQLLNQAKPDDAWRACCEFYEKAIEDYRTEYGQLTTLGTNILNETLAGSMKAFGQPGAQQESAQPAKAQDSTARPERVSGKAA